jgi:hypothetical protein
MVRAEDCPHANVLMLFRTRDPAPGEHLGQESESAGMDEYGRCRICLHRVKRVQGHGQWSPWRLDPTVPRDRLIEAGVVNPLGLSAAELDAIRDLQTGVHRIDGDDPIWDGLAEVGLVDKVELALGRAQLTIRGSAYRTQ